jgi:predicted transcriptional regulator
MSAEWKHRAALVRYMGNGMTQPEIARALGIGVRTIREHLAADPSIRVEAAERLEKKDPGAVETLRALLADPDPRIRLGAATALLRAPDPDADPAGQQIVTLRVDRYTDGRAEEVSVVSDVDNGPAETIYPFSERMISD